MAEPINNDEHPVVPDEKTYVPAADPRLEAFRYQPHAVETSAVPVTPASAEVAPASPNEYPVIADENQYQPAADPRLEAFRYKPPEKTTTQ